MSEPAKTSPVITAYKDAPVPTKASLRWRRNIPLQLVKFAEFNGRLAMMVLKGHDDH
ncbi:MAG: hypothetical protein LWW86_04585 [Micrococcales bacterium]|nr:hypothetical protein [Micrococcales bacterium]